MQKNIPMRPFQAPPSLIDVTKDCLFEKKWLPILPAKKRPKPEDVDHDEIATAKFDRNAVDRNLFDLFYDQSEMLKEMDP